MSAIQRALGERGDHVPNQARDVLARADCDEDPTRITLIDCNENPMTEWISVDADVIEPVGGEISR